MNHKERMKQGLLYNPNLPELADEQFVYMDRLWEFNQLKPSQFAEKERYMKEMFAECGRIAILSSLSTPTGAEKMYTSEIVCMPILTLPWWMTVTFT